MSEFNSSRPKLTVNTTAPTDNGTTNWRQSRTNSTIDDTISALHQQNAANITL